MTIKSHKGAYEVHFDRRAIDRLDDDVPPDIHFIIDSAVAELYRDRLSNVLNQPSVLLVEATEHNKSLDRVPDYVEHLVEHGFRRNHRLLGIGGGIIQDITCFLAATMMRGVQWIFYPTTLLSQADSCVGSKSSINSGNAKNIVGTFTPPNEVHISTDFLATLDEKDVRSGVGEILKVHAIDGPESFDRLAGDYPRLFSDPAVMEHYINRALEIKRPYVERDEFDTGIRNIFNYGHSFGHAIEAATDFGIPHGIAVTMGMDMANFVTRELGIGSEASYGRMHPALRSNYAGFESFEVPLDPFLAAIMKDKKNVGRNEVTIIVPDRNESLHKVRRACDEDFRDACGAFLATGRAN